MTPRCGSSIFLHQPRGLEWLEPAGKTQKSIGLCSGTASSKSNQGSDLIHNSNPKSRRHPFKFRTSKISITSFFRLLLGINSATLIRTDPRLVINHQRQVSIWRLTTEPRASTSHSSPARATSLWSSARRLLSARRSERWSTACSASLRQDAVTLRTSSRFAVLFPVHLTLNFVFLVRP